MKSPLSPANIGIFPTCEAAGAPSLGISIDLLIIDVDIEAPLLLGNSSMFTGGEVEETPTMWVVSMLPLLSPSEMLPPGTTAGTDNSDSKDSKKFVLGESEALFFDDTSPEAKFPISVDEGAGCVCETAAASAGPGLELKSIKLPEFAILGSVRFRSIDPMLLEDAIFCNDDISKNKLMLHFRNLGFQTHALY